MKKIVLFLTYMCLLGFSSCVVDDTPDRSFEELPALTTTGEGMLAFKHGSESYIKQNGLNNAFYQLSDEGPVLIIGVDWTNKEIEGLTIGTLDIEIEEGLTIDFNDKSLIGAWYSFFYTDGVNFEFIRSNQNSSGSIKINFFDPDNNIVSGTFNTEFTRPFTGEIIKITDGRFDTFFRR